jgi:hypothetical protein
MKNTNLFLPGFHLSTLRKKPISKAQKLAVQIDKIKQHSISQLGKYFDQFIPKEYLENNQKGKFSRLRLFSKSNTFCENILENILDRHFLENKYY